MRWYVIVLIVLFPVGILAALYFWRKSKQTATIPAAMRRNTVGVPQSSAFVQPGGNTNQPILQTASLVGAGAEGAASIIGAITRQPDNDTQGDAESGVGYTNGYANGARGDDLDALDS